MSQQVQSRPYRVRDAAPGGGPEAARRLREEFGGAVLLPGDPGYDEQREAPNADIDPRPALIAEADDPADVRAAILTAREHGLPFAVQATGHGTYVASDGGVLLRTGRMDSVLVDPDRRIARVGPGTTWAEVIAAAEPFGLAPLAGSHQTVGVTGYTLGGGIGWLARGYGFASDSVLRAEMVTADGRLVTASPDRNPDLFWALRGGGGNFGVVTSLEFRLHPVARVHAGALYFTADRAAETLTRYREWMADAPRELSTSILLARFPDAPETPAPLRDRWVLGLRVMYAGEAEEARAALRPLTETAGPVLLDDLRTTTFAQAEMGGIAPRDFNLLETLPDDVIEAVAAVVGRPDSPVTMVEVRHWGGAMTDAGPDAGPVGHRTAQLSVVLDACDPQVSRVLRPHSGDRTFLNFLGDTTRAETAYTPGDHRRLRDVKRTYDPDNFFRLNHNIPPAEPGSH
ncbi:FAD-binding oxidoreductase [Streptosporangium sandarakinum]|uniref:FAD-binding oxidoreductase n=1 Tax=Streptosporangium sandarakinum TaxID=1260955 RepID=UPI003D8BE609